MHRYKVAQVMAEGPYVECHPREPDGTDPFASESAKRVLMSIIEDNTNRYSKFRRRVVSGGFGVGTWFGMVHWKHDRGPFGDVVFESLEPWQVKSCPGYLDLHDPCNPWVIIERHERIDSIRAKGGDGEYDWKNTEDLWPDNKGKFRDIQSFARADAEPSPVREHGPDTVTVLYYLARDAKETYKEDAGFRDLEPDQQYMACPDCAHKEYEHERMPDGSLPEVGDACPGCLEKMMKDESLTPSYLYRVTREKLTNEKRRYTNGKMCIVAPYQHKVFYEGPWQAPCRSFPILQFRAYESPYEPWGGTDTLLYHSLQALMDQLRKQAYEQMVTSKPLLIFAGGPGDGRGLVDFRGEPFRYTDANGQVAYAPDAAGNLAAYVHQFSPNGMPGSLPVLYNILSQSFHGSRGIGQVQFGPEQSKDVAYKSLLLQKESGDVPVEDHKQVWREEEGLFLGCVLDVWVANSSDARAVRYFGQNGAVGFQLLRGSDIPNVDVIVGTPPQIRQGAIEEVNAIMQWVQIPIASARRIVAQKLNLAPSEVAEVEAELAAARQAQTQMPPPGGPGGQPMPDMSAAMGGAPPPGFMGA